MAKIIFLYFLAATVLSVEGYGTYGYSDGLYEASSESHSGEKREKCKNLKFYQFETESRYDQVLREPLYQKLWRNGKSYLKISCPNDSQYHALVAKNDKVEVEIYSPTYYVAVLAAGFNLETVVKCEDGKILARTTDNRDIKIEEVACLSYMYFESEL